MPLSWVSAPIIQWVSLNSSFEKQADKLYGENSYEHCKIIHYPKSSKNITQGVGSHKDGGLITFVFQEKMVRIILEMKQ